MSANRAAEPAVAVLHDGRLGAGAHELTLDGATLTPGVYLVRATVSGPDGATEAYTRRITLVE